MTELKPRAQHTGMPGLNKILKLARKGDREAIRDHLDRDPDLLHAKSQGHSRTLLWEATRGNRWALVEYLVQRGADVNVPGRHRHESFVLLKPYCVARTFGRDALAEYLLNHGTVVDIYSAAYLGDTQRVLELLEHDPGRVNREQAEETVWRVTPLHHAVSGEQDHVLALLLERGAEVMAYSGLLLEIAARRRRPDLVQRLLDCGAEARRVPVFGALHDDKVLRVLVEQGLDVNRSQYGWPPIAYVSRGDKGEHPERVKMLLDLGADVNACGSKGATALHAAAKAGFLSVIAVLVENGADVNARTLDGTTPLKMAMKAKRTRTVEMLKRYGATV
jgi:ankyrin repeat protein